MMVKILHNEVITDKPEWITEPITGQDIATIQHGGCDCGGVGYDLMIDAPKTMAVHGDEVLEYLRERFGIVPEIPLDTDWSGIACFYLSRAVETWAHGYEVVDGRSGQPSRYEVEGRKQRGAAL